MLHDGFVATPFGRSHVVREGDGHPLVLLHSNGNSWHEYDRVRAGLITEVDLVVCDLPGQGDSDPLPRHLSIDDYADAVVAVLDGLGIDRAAVMGASVGGCIAASVGARHADRLTGVGIIESQVRSPQWWADGWLGIERLFAVPAQSAEQIQARFHTADASLVERVNIDRHKAGSASMMNAMWAIREFDIAQAAAAISLPALVIYGTAGPCFETADAMRASLPNAAYVVIDGAGHFPMVDHPSEFTDVVLTFVRGLTTG